MRSSPPSGQNCHKANPIESIIKIPIKTSIKIPIPIWTYSNLFRPLWTNFMQFENFFLFFFPFLKSPLRGGDDGSGGRNYFFTEKNVFCPFLGASRNKNICATIHIGREIWCLLYAGFFFLLKKIFQTKTFFNKNQIVTKLKNSNVTKIQNGTTQKLKM